MRLKCFLFMLIFIIGFETAKAQTPFTFVLGTFEFTLSRLRQFEMNEGQTFWLLEGQLYNTGSSDQCLSDFDLRLWLGGENALLIGKPNLSIHYDNDQLAMMNVCLSGDSDKNVYIVAEIPDSKPPENFQIRYKGRRVVEIEMLATTASTVSVNGVTYNAQEFDFRGEAIQPPLPLLELQFGDLRFYVEDSFFRSNENENSIGGSWILSGYLENLSQSEICLYSSDVRLHINNNFYEADLSLMRNKGNEFGTDYPGYWFGHCVDGLTSDVYTFLFFTVPQTLQTTDILYDDVVIATVNFERVGLEGLRVFDISKFDLSDVTVETREETVNTFEIDLPNCEGTSELTVERTLETEYEHQTVVQAAPGKVVSSFIPSIPVIDIKGKVDETLDIGFNYETQTDSRVKTSQTVTMSAAPRTRVTYELAWVMTSYAGSALLQFREENPSEIEFIFDDHLTLTVTESREEACE